MHQEDATTIASKTEPFGRWGRVEEATILDLFESAPTSSQRQFAQQVKVPRSTLQYWLARKGSIDADRGLVEFFESPEGLAFLHRLVVAAHLIFTQVGPCGTQLVCEFLKRTGLDRFVASSYGSQYAVSVDLQREIIDFGHEERLRLAAEMPAKSITVCEDETFHPRICLVAIEPVSDFILLEAYSDHRDADSWTVAMAGALEGLNVDVVQAVSDEAKGLLAHARQGLGAEHSPDLFHVQQELSQASSFVLRSKTRQAEAELQRAQSFTAEWVEKQQIYESSGGGVGRPPDFATHIKCGQQIEQTREKELEICLERQAQMREAIRGLGDDYHPVDLETGVPCTAAQVQQKLKQRFAEIDRIVEEAELPQRSRKHIEKARRMLDTLTAALTWVLRTIQSRVKELALSTELRQMLLKELIPGLYLERAARKARCREDCQAIGELAERILARARSPDGPLACLPLQRRQEVERTAAWCADLFQRSSSCVEGRNGQLSLRHHSFHQLSTRKLNVLTTVHNYYVTRSDGTTAAERFFEARPRDLFDWLLDRLDVPARPAKPRAAANRLAA